MAAIAAFAGYGSDSGSDSEGPRVPPKAPQAQQEQKARTAPARPAGSRPAKALPRAAGVPRRAVGLGRSTGRAVGRSGDSGSDEEEGDGESSGLASLQRIREQQLARQLMDDAVAEAQGVPTGAGAAHARKVQRQAATEPSVPLPVGHRAAPARPAATASVAGPALPVAVSTLVAPDTGNSRYAGRQGVSRRFTPLAWSSGRAAKRGREDDEGGAGGPARSQQASGRSRYEAGAPPPAGSALAGMDPAVLRSLDPRARRELGRASASAAAALPVMHAGARQAAWEAKPSSAVPVEAPKTSVVTTKRWDAETGETVLTQATSDVDRGRNHISKVAQRAVSMQLQMAHTAGGGGGQRTMPKQKYGW